jgi:hypothetical protein
MLQHPFLAGQHVVVFQPAVIDGAIKIRAVAGAAAIIGSDYRIALRQEFADDVQLLIRTKVAMDAAVDEDEQWNFLTEGVSLA